ncbi:fasciclin domain-containing protein [Phenylobacterium sp.]|jgi:uncharacterized surface protein with fasciclin (FAS1) repeats|uniref:fasciclin domain-containing protein n=1 Tax=Phenylobacterium sp. TaxID=1871053 RepID=UPI0037C7449B
MIKSLTTAAALALATLAFSPAYAADAKGDIVAVAAGAGQFKTLLAAATAAGLVDTLKSPGPFTVFAPTDAAFAALPAGTVDTLLKPENKAQLASILTYHVVPGRTLSPALAGKQLTVTTVQGGTLAIDGRNGVTVNGAKVVSADVAASNGVIHVIDKVLLPPAK